MQHIIDVQEYRRQEYSKVQLNKYMSVCQNFLFMARPWMIWGVLSLYKDSVACFCEVSLCSCESKKTIRLTDPTRSLPCPLLLFVAFYCRLPAFYCLSLLFTAFFCPLPALYCTLLPFTALHCPLLPFTARSSGSENDLVGTD